MGKTKTAFVTETGAGKKTSEELYREKRERQAAAAKAKEAQKIHISGLKGGQRVKIVEAETLPEQESERVKEQEKKIERKPKIRGKKYQEAKAKIDKNKIFSPKEAIALVKETSFSTFDGTVELHLVVKKAGLSVNLTLPHTAGKEKKIEMASDATVEKLKMGKIDFDVLVATPEIMPKLIPFAKILGPKGLMPNPKNGTLVPDLKKAKIFSGNSVTVKTEKDAPLIHTTLGKISQPESQLTENLEALIKAVSEKQIIRAYLKATMGPSIKLKI